MDDQKFYMSFITILCDYKCANTLSERDGSEMKRRRGRISEEKRDSKKGEDKESEMQFTLF